jgi:lipopolysaccharide transport system ATP-binding protein
VTDHQIEIRNLGKRYKRYANRWARMADMLSGGRLKPYAASWALLGISFSVETGESIGIVGQNGAGKSTLLKLLTGTSQPTEGEISLRGRVAALLELGMGFHPDFTGRENAALTCRMMGLDRDEVDEVLPEVASFSELGDYMDQPMRVYSTGMQVRLAFSAATAVRPELLIVDEALSVGDAYFQHKCIRRIRGFLEKGTTLLFVSHDPAAVKSLCRRAILLEKGRLLMDDTPLAVLDYYNGLIAQRSDDQMIVQEQGPHGGTTRSGSGEVRITDIAMVDAHGKDHDTFCTGDSAAIRCRIIVNTPVENLSVGLNIRDRLGNDVFGSNTHHLSVRPDACRAGDLLEVSFAMTLNLGSGHYAVTLAAHAFDSHVDSNYDWWDRCLIFHVLPGSGPVFIGVAALPITATIQKVRGDDRTQQPGY